jgi:hypothetical protein
LEELLAWLGFVCAEATVIKDKPRQTRSNILGSLARITHSQDVEEQRHHGVST